MPEVEALGAFLRERLLGSHLAGVDVAAINALKTFDPPVGSLAGLEVTGISRAGKFLVIGCDGLALVFHLAKAGWLRWYDKAPGPARPGKGPLALRVRFAAPDGGLPGFDLTEAGTQKRLAVYVVRALTEVPGIAALGPDPLADDFTELRFAEMLDSGRRQLKGLLRDQKLIAGIGNAYSDEILHRARMSPFALTDTLDDAGRARLFAAIREVLRDAVVASSGRPAAELKDAKRRGLAVHARTGLPCPVCGDLIREVSFASSALQYCPGCQTGGRILADRRTSAFLK